MFSQLNADFLNKVYLGDVIDFLPKLASNSVHCIVTSPPYWAVRDYKIEPTAWPEVKYRIFGFEITIPPMVCQLGHEATPEQFVGHMVYIFREARRVLRNDGTLWMNMGDSYNSKSLKGIKSKDMVGIPWMLAFAMREDGWYLRQDIIWHKLNPMPESTNDRCTKGHEYVFLFSKKERYYFDQYAISTEITDSSVKRLSQNIENQQGSLIAYGGTRPDVKMKAGSKFKTPDGWDTGKGSHGNFHKEGREKGKTGYVHKHNQPGNWHQHENYHNTHPDPKNLKRDGKTHSMHEGRKAEKLRREEEKNYGINGKGFQGHSGYFDKDGNMIGNGRANKRSVWSITNKGTNVEHFATYPEELVVDPIKAGSSEHGCCSKCGAPWKRSFDKNLVPGHGAIKTHVVDERDANADAEDQGANRKKDGHKNGHHYEYSNFNWVPTCNCNAEVIPCVVMDFFSGTKTTGIVSRKLGRNFIAGEKSANYIEIGERISYKELGMFS